MKNKTMPKIFSLGFIGLYLQQTGFGFKHENSFSFSSSNTSLRNLRVDCREGQHGGKCVKVKVCFEREKGRFEGKVDNWTKCHI